MTESTKKTSRHAQAAAVRAASFSPRTANELFARGLDGDDLEDAFAALSEREKTRFVDDPRRYLQAPTELSFY